VFGAVHPNVWDDFQYLRATNHDNRLSELPRMEASKAVHLIDPSPRAAPSSAHAAAPWVFGVPSVRKPGPAGRTVLLRRHRVSPPWLRRLWAARLDAWWARAVVGKCVAW